MKKKKNNDKSNIIIDGFINNISVFLITFLVCMIQFYLFKDYYRDSFVQYWCGIGYCDTGVVNSPDFLHNILAIIFIIYYLISIVISLIIVIKNRKQKIYVTVFNIIFLIINFAFIIIGPFSMIKDYFMY